jgi:acetyl esterase/lipase
MPKAFEGNRTWRCAIMAIAVMLVTVVDVSADGEPKITKDIKYASVGARDLLLDLYLPRSEEKSRLVVWIHGGAWHSGSKENPPLQIVESGYALASVEYRLTPEARFPANVHDIKAAFRFLRGNASKYGYRADKVAIFGASAGGHLAALVGVTNGVEALEGTLGEYTSISSDVQAIVDAYGPTNFLTILEQSTPHGIGVRAPAMALLFGDVPDRTEEPMKLASPVFHVDKDDPPLLLLHGDRDIQAPINQAHELQGKYEENGLRAEMFVAHGVGHSSEVYTENWGVVERFLSSVLK